MKTTLRKEDILAELYTGKKFTTTEWKDDSYIHMVNGQIVDHDNQDFNLMGTPYDEWIEYIEVKTTEIKLDTMTNEEAIQALFNEERIKSASWKDDSYIHMVDGQIVDHDNEIFNLMQANVDDWVIVEACQTSDNFNEIQELKAMIEELLENSNQTKEVSREKKEKDGTATDKEYNHELLLNVYGVTGSKELEKQFKEQLESAASTEDIQKTVCEYIPYCWMGNRTLGTTAVYYSHLRKVIRTLNNEEYRDLALLLFLPTQSTYDAVQDKNTENKKEELREKIYVEVKPVFEKLATIKEKFLENEFENFREKAYYAYTYLLIVTGRRTVEILGSLEIKKDKNKWVYSKIAKKRELDNAVEAISIDNDFEFLIDLLECVQDYTRVKITEAANRKFNDVSDKNEREKLRKEHTEELSSKRGLNSKFQKTLSDAVQRIMGFDLTPKQWRDFWGDYIWKTLGNKEGSHIDERDFKAEIIGHEDDGRLSATEHYDVVKAVL